MSFDPAQILIWTVFSAITAGILVFIVRAVFRDRSHGRRRCPRCWHDMQETPGLRCPECGFTARDESRLFATRRHWRRAAALLSCLVVGAMAVRISLTEENLFEYAPTWFLVDALPFSAPQGVDQVREALRVRIAGRTLSEAQIHDLVERIRVGDPGALPASLTWQSRYGTLLEAFVQQASEELESDGPEDVVLRALEPLRELPPSVLLTAPQNWPIGTPLIVEVRIDDWWPPMTSARVRVRDESDGTERVMGLDSGASGSPRYQFSFSPLGEAEIARAFTVTVEARKTAPNGLRDPSQPWGPAHVNRFNLTLAPSAAVKLEPLRDDAADEALRSVFARGLVAWSRGWRRYGLMFDASRTSEEIFSGTLIGIEIEVFEGDRLRRRSHIWWPAGGNRVLARWALLEEDPTPIPGLVTGAPGWRARIRGSSEIALRAIASLGGSPTLPNGVAYTRYWDGDVTVPLDVTVNDNSSPARRWVTLPPEDLPMSAPSNPPSAPAANTAPPSEGP
jgi:hypothetical protein